MGFNCGIVGLPNVGKSTIFNAMTAAGAEASNYPFCTINPNIGMVPLRDERIYRIASLVKPERTLPTAVEFVDIAGIVKGASKGEGLGNQFLGNIRSVDMVAHVVRCFEDEQVVHVDGKVDPRGDIETINTELILADMDSVERRLDRASKLAKSGDKAVAEALPIYQELKKAFDAGRPARSVLTRETALLVKDLNLLTAKPVIYVANVGEDDLSGISQVATKVREVAEAEGAGFVIICGKIESEIAELSEEERAGFLSGLGLSESGLDRLAAAAYRLLGLITFFTAGKKEVRAWTVEEGSKAPAAAGVIHSDFERGFIKAEVISYEDFIKYGSEASCREKGVLRIEGKEYVVKDGDLMHFRFNV
ncbi:MAG: redox-regulated ATPase YchF [Deltaproteobacteria bacterium]|nr:redox-regulated ATPase YchF [Deltaproteobacteria bacterium]MBZ0219354.1 redox-regulated ATPase YchF [Deltaproteobacteria bacterium]